MFRRSDTNFALLLLSSDLVLTDFALFLARKWRLTLPYGVPIVPVEPYFTFPPYLFVLVPFVWVVVFLAMSVYDSHRTLRATNEIQAVIASILISTVLFAGFAYFFFREFSRVLFIYFFLLDLAFLVSWRVLLRVAFRLRRGGWPHNSQRIVIVGAGKVGHRIGNMLADYQWAGSKLVGYLDDDPAKRGQTEPAPILGTLTDTLGVVRDFQVDELIIALPLRAHERLVELVLETQRLPVRIHVVPDLFDLAFSPTTVEELDGIPMVGLRDSAIEGFPSLVKRVFDLVIGSIALLFALPVMATVAVAIKVGSPGPIIFSQQRVGENSKLFWMHKFRSMEQDAQNSQMEVMTCTPDGEVTHKRPNDPRVTRVGRFIRSTSLDELPQLFNVLKGEMSLVGPRPELPWLVENYKPWQRKRFAVPQGITGWWQVNGRSKKPMHLHVAEDLYYIQNYSLLLDIQILWKTFAAVFNRRGAF